MTRTVPLGDVVNLKRGYDLPSSQRVAGRFPIISSSGVSGSHIEAKVKAPGVVTGRYGTLGEVFYIAEDFWPLNTTLYVEDFMGNDPKYVAYLLDSLNLSQENIAGAVPGVNRNFLHKIRVPYLDKDQQAKVVDIIDPINEKIELNRRMNETLEQMGQALFHQCALKVESSPTRQIVKLGDVLELHYGKGLTAKNRNSGPYPVYGSSGVIDYHDEFLVKSPGIIIGRKGNVGSVFWAEGNFCPIDTVFYVTSSLPLSFMYFYLKKAKFINSDAAVPGLSRSQVYGLDFARPDKATVEEIAPQLSLLLELQCRNSQESANLTMLRDSLLPRLISGGVKNSQPSQHLRRRLALYT